MLVDCKEYLRWSGWRRTSALKCTIYARWSPTVVGNVIGLDVTDLEDAQVGGNICSLRWMSVRWIWWRDGEKWSRGSWNCDSDIRFSWSYYVHVHANSLNMTNEMRIHMTRTQQPATLSAYHRASQRSLLRHHPCSGRPALHRRRRILGSTWLL